MDALQITFICVMVLVFILLTAAILCYKFGPRTMAWFRSNREEKIGLSKSKIFHANGYMIHSGSDFLQLSSTGSFKRFDSIDRDYKQVGQSSVASPSWNIPPSDTHIPPQPLRPAPAPLPAASRQNGIRHMVIERETIDENQATDAFNELPFVRQLPYYQQIIEKPIKQKSLDKLEISSSKSISSPAINTAAIPRPVAKRQLSTPVENCFAAANGGPGIAHLNGVLHNGEVAMKINLSEVANKIQANNLNNQNNNNNNIIENEMKSTVQLSSAASAAATNSIILPGKLISPKIRRQRLLIEHQQQQMQRISNNTAATTTTTNPFVNGNAANGAAPEPDKKPVSIASSIVSQSSPSSIAEQVAEQPNDEAQSTNAKNTQRKNEINLKAGSNSTFAATTDQKSSTDFMKRYFDRNVLYAIRNELNNAKNPFTADSILEYQRLRHKQANISSSEDAFDLLPELKEPPKTDLDRFTIFNFEPDSINTMLTTTPRLTGFFEPKSETNTEHNNNNNYASKNRSGSELGSPLGQKSNRINSSLTSITESMSTITSPNSPRNSSFDSYNSSVSQQNDANNMCDFQANTINRNEKTTITACNSLPPMGTEFPKSDPLSKVNDLNQSNRHSNTLNTNVTRNFLLNRFDSNIEKIINENLSEFKQSNLHNYNSTSVPSLFNLNNDNCQNGITDLLTSQNDGKSFPFSSTSTSFWNNLNTLSNYNTDGNQTTSAAKPPNALNLQRKSSSASQLLCFDKRFEYEKQQADFNRSPKSFKYNNGNSIGYQSPYYSLQKTLFTSAEKRSSQRFSPSIFDYSNGISQLSKYFGLSGESHAADSPVQKTLDQLRSESMYPAVKTTHKESDTEFFADASLSQVKPLTSKPSEENGPDTTYMGSASSPKMLAFQNASSNNLQSNGSAFYSVTAANDLDFHHTTANNNNNISIVKRYLDSPCSDVFDDIEQMIRKRCRSRSHSETEVNDCDLNSVFSRHSRLRRSLNTNPFVEKGNQMIHKTISENFLAKSFNTGVQQQQQQQQNYQTWCFGRTFSRQESLSFNLGRRNSSQSSINDSERQSSLESLQHAISCESINSVSSVVLSDLEPVLPPVTGQLCVGLKYDRSTIDDDMVQLNVNVMEAKELIGPESYQSFDTFVRIYLVPDETGARQTKLFKNSTSPCYNETFSFCLNTNRGRRSLWFHLYQSGASHYLIGETELQIADVSTARPFTTWLSLSDTRNLSPKWGELMFSLSYLPTAERLTVVIVKGRSFQFEQNVIELDSQNIFVKVYLLKDNKKLCKKKTSVKRKDLCPIFNESMTFSIPPYVLNSIQIRLTVMSISSDQQLLMQQQQQQQQQYPSVPLMHQQQQQQKSETLGHVFIGNGTTGKGIKHWNQMLSSLRKPVAMWHPLRKTKPKSIKKTSNEIT